MLFLPCAAFCCSMQASAQDQTGPAVISADPASGTKVTSLSEIDITLDQEMDPSIWEWEMESTPLPAVFGAPSDVTAMLWYGKDDYKKAKIIITPEITADGTYEITIPSGHFWNTNYDGSPECKLVYTIGSGASGEEPVQYDVRYTSIEPEPGTYEALNAVTLTFDTDVVVTDESRAYLYKDNIVYKGVHMDMHDGNKVNLLFENFDTEGIYELVVEKAQIGDAKWLESPHLGHANPEFRIPGYKIKHTASKLTYDFIPALFPDGAEALGSLDKLTLTFDGPWCAASEETIALYDYKEDEIPMTVSMGDTLNEAVLSLDSHVNEAGQYRLVIPKGRFADSDYEESAGEEGALNPEITLTFDIDPSLDGVRSIGAEGISFSTLDGTLVLGGNGHVGIYTVQGLRVADIKVSGHASATLMPGLYIVRTDEEAVKVFIK